MNSGLPVALSSNGTAALLVSTLAIGPHSIVAEYNDDHEIDSNTGNLTTVVSAASTNTALTTPTAAIVYGHSASFTVTVSANSPSGSMPTGSVQFLIDGVDFGSPVVLDPNGRASVAMPILQAGPHEVSAAFVPASANFLASDDESSPATLAVTPAPLTITAENASKIYGANVPTLVASYTGFVNGETSVSLTTQPKLVTTGSQVGSYAITASGAVDADYAITYVAGSLNITPAPLTISAENASKIYGANLPTLSVSFNGLVNGDTSNILTKQPTLTTTATAGSGGRVLSCLRDGRGGCELRDNLRRRLPGGHARAVDDHGEQRFGSQRRGHSAAFRLL